MNDPTDVFALSKTLRVLVTAGASGIGRAAADLLIARGAQVHICDVSDAFLADYCAAHPKAGVTRADVASDADVARLFDDVKASLGGLDALINNAGIAGPTTGGVDEIKPEDWRRTIDVCLTGQFLCAHFAVPMLKAAGGGSIINLSSAAGRFGYAFRTPYSAAKFGIIGLTQSLAKELGPANIRVNAILPGIRRRAAHDRGDRRARETNGRQLRSHGKDLSRESLDAPNGDRKRHRRDHRVLAIAGGPERLRPVDRRGRQCRDIVTDRRLTSEGEMAKVAVIGSGFVGRAWAISFARARCEVALWDQDKDAPAKALSYIERLLPELEANDLLNGSAASEVSARIRVATTLKSALEGTVHVQENTPEDVEVKRAVFARLDAAAPSDTVLASSTSAILPSAFTEKISRAALVALSSIQSIRPILFRLPKWSRRPGRTWQLWSARQRFCAPQVMRRSS